MRECTAALLAINRLRNCCCLRFGGALIHWYIPKCLRICRKIIGMTWLGTASNASQQRDQSMVCADVNLLFAPFPQPARAVSSRGALNRRGHHPQAGTGGRGFPQTVAQGRGMPPRCNPFGEEGGGRHVGGR